MTADDILFRCSGVGNIMGKLDGGLTTKQAETLQFLQAKKDRTTLGLTDKEYKKLLELTAKSQEFGLPAKAIVHCIDLYLSQVWGRKERKDNKFLRKGNEREEESISLISLRYKKFFKKNTIRKNNKFITGEWDAQIGSAEKILETLDTKTSWSAHTFFRSAFKPLDINYEYQGHGYMDLTGAEKHTVAFCLVNGTSQAIVDEKRRLSWQLGMSSTEDYNDPKYDEFVEGCKQIERNHIFDIEAFKEENKYFDWHNKEFDFDIPAEKRVKVFEFQRNEDKIKFMREQIILCRKFMAKHLFN